MLIGILFYKSIIAILLLSPYCLIYVKEKKKEEIIKIKWRLNLEFRDCILSISAALNAGYSMENAMRESMCDMKVLYGQEALIVKEFEYMISQLKNNQTMEEIWQEFAIRSGVEDIYSFSEVFITAKRSGGDLIKIIKGTSKVIGDKIDIKREILTITTGKRLETRIMNMIPLGIILYMWMFSPGFLDPLYHNTIGILIMTIALVGYYGSVILSKRIMNIDV